MHIHGRIKSGKLSDITGFGKIIIGIALIMNQLPWPEFVARVFL
jgi:hypothetical protein